MYQSSNEIQDEFVETIRVEQGRAWNLEYHNERMNRTRRAFWGNNVEELHLEDWLHPETYTERTRCRVVYGRNICQVEYFPYQMRLVRNLKLVTCDEAQYVYKSTDRSQLNSLYDLRGEADEILIVRNGRLTDTSIANIALYDGKQWCTPTFPLLKGTQRARLLHEGCIVEKDILVFDIGQYQKIRLFNAMIPFGIIELDTVMIESLGK